MVRIKIFDVEHGQCAFIEHGDECMLIDCGHNGSTGWRPSSMLRARGIDHLDALILSNADEDHASDFPNLIDVASIGRIYSNPTLRGTDILKLKGQDRCGPGIRAFTELLDACGPLSPDNAAPWLGGLQMHFFWNEFPHHFQDENNLSLVTLLRWPGLTICFPGDMEKAGWLRLLQMPAFRAAMRDVDIFIASHHGRENGFSEPLFRVTGLNPQLIIISDSGIEHASQETVARYGREAKGLWFGDERRLVLTTRCDGRIQIDLFEDRSWTVSTLAF